MSNQPDQSDQSEPEHHFHCDACAEYPGVSAAIIGAVGINNNAYAAIHAVAPLVAELAERLKQAEEQIIGLKCEQAAISQAIISAELPTEDTTGLSDLVDLMAVFINHHKRKEDQVKALEAEIEAAINGYCQSTCEDGWGEICKATEARERRYQRQQQQAQPPATQEPCPEQLESIPFASDHLFNADHHNQPYGPCTKCGSVTAAEWMQKMAQHAKIVQQQQEEKG